MQAIGAILIIFNLITAVGPIAGTALLYQNHLDELIIPPELTELISETIEAGQQTNIVHITDYEYDADQMLFRLEAEFFNPVDYPMELKELSAKVYCNLHNAFMGKIELDQPVLLDAQTSTNVNIFGQWAASSENHFMDEHYPDSNFDAKIVGLTANLNDISIELNEPVVIPNVPVN